MKFIFIRHGKTKGNEEKRYVGKTDQHLSPLGIAEIKKITYPAADLVFASPRIRCRETAALIYPDQEINIVDDLREMDFGDFESKNYEELKNDPIYQKWLDSNGTMPCPNGESRENFAARCVEAFWRAIKKTDTAKIGTAAFVVHGGTIMALMDNLTLHNGQYYDFLVENACGYICSFDGKYLKITGTIPPAEE
ncbi:MAG: histidine phosphatase family protein [Bacillota bacterium]|jgi:alpha-ribazole phosphatase